MQEYFPGALCTNSHMTVASFTFVNVHCEALEPHFLHLLAEWPWAGYFLGHLPHLWNGRSTMCIREGGREKLESELRAQNSSLGPCRSWSLRWWRWNPWALLEELMTLNRACGKGSCETVVGFILALRFIPTLPARPQEKSPLELLSWSLWTSGLPYRIFGLVLSMCLVCRLPENKCVVTSTHLTWSR